PGPVALQTQDVATASADHAADGVQKSVAEFLGLPVTRLTLQAKALVEDQQILGGKHQLQPDLVGGKVTEGKVLEPGVIGTTDPVLDAGVGAMACLQRGHGARGLIGDKDLEAVAVVIGEAELGTGMGTLAPTDGAGARRPALKIEVDQLADSSPFALLAILLDGRHPGAFWGGQDRLPHRLRHGEADRAADLQLAPGIHERMARALAVRAS